MKPQKIKVQNKNQLIAAFGCAVDYPGPTLINLRNEKLDILYSLKSGKSCFRSYSFEKSIRRARGKIRKIPASFFS